VQASQARVSSLKILQAVSNSATSGGEKIALELAKMLAARGHHVTFSCPPDTWLEQDATRQGLDVVPIDFRKHKGVPGMIALTRYVRGQSFDILHTHLSRATYAGLLATRFVPAPMVSTVHVGTNEPVYRYVARGENHVVAVSNYVKKNLISKGVDERHVSVVHNGTDLHLPPAADREEILRELDIPFDRKIVGLIGRVAPQKGHHLMVAALPGILKRLPEAHLVFAGRMEGPFPETLKQQLASQGLTDRVTFTGNRSDIYRILDAVELTVLPSSAEAFGLAVIESYARKRPVVASNVQGLPEVIQDGETGILVPLEPESIAEAVAKLLKDSALRQRMAEAGHQKILRQFTMERMVENVETLYGCMVEKRAAS
jgi:glycosyltransferase involved in cell wall biosynthesis